jgi:fatty-acid desaturase
VGGWILTQARERYAPDLLADPVASFVDRTAIVWVTLSLLAPLAAGLAIYGTLEGALIGLLWGGAVRSLRRSELDLGGLVIRGLERLGLVWDVKRVSSERQLRKLRPDPH